MADKEFYKIPIHLFTVSERVKTFVSWPDDISGSCTPEKLAEAGFYHQPCKDCPDNTCCVFCMKELDGWEPDDDPLAEHKKHSPQCPLLSEQQPFDPRNMTIRNFFAFLANVQQSRYDTMLKRRKKEFEDAAARVRENIMENM